MTIPTLDRSAGPVNGKPASQAHAITRGPLGFVAVAAVMLGALLFQMLFFDRWINMMDEGHILQYADMIRRGGELYRDATVYPLPGAFYFLAFIFQFVEPSYMVSRWIVSIEFAVLVGLCFVVLRRLVSPGWAWFGALMVTAYRVWSFPHWHMYSYSTTALFLFLCCFLVLHRYFQTKRTWLLICAGLIFGIGVAFKQDYGAAALVALMIYIIVTVRSDTHPLSVLRVVGGFLGSGALVGAAVGVYFWVNGILPDLIQFTVLNHFVGMSSYEYRSYPDILPLFVRDENFRTDAGVASYMPAVIVTTNWQALNDSWLFQKTGFWETLMKGYFYAPFLLLFYGALRLGRRRAELYASTLRERYLVEFGFFCLAAAWFVWMHIYRPQDYVHLAAVYWPLVCLVVIYSADFFRSRRRPLLLVAYAAVVAILLAQTGRYAWLLRSLNDTEVPLARAGGLHATRDQAEVYAEVVQFVQENSEPQDQVAVLPYSPGLSFLAGRDGPHRTSYILWPFAELENRDAMVIDALERSPVDFLIYDFGYFHDFPRVSEYAFDLFNYIVDNYEMNRVFSSDAQWSKKLASAVRKKESTEGVSVFEQGRGRMRVFVESDLSPIEPVSPSQWGAYVRQDVWPFRRVMTLRPSSDRRRTVLSIPIDVSVGTILKTSISVKPVLWDELPPSWVDFAVTVNVDDHRTRVFEKRLDSTRIVEDRGWFDVEVPLSSYAGQNVRLEFSTGAERPRAEHPFMGGWGDPRLIEATADGSAS